MRKGLSLIFLIIPLTSFNQEVCKNAIRLIEETSDIPILNLDISKDTDSIRKEMCKLYNEDLCQRCSKVDFRVPIEIEGKKIHLKVSTSFGYQFCENCPILDWTCNLGASLNWQNININGGRREIFANDQIISNLDSLQRNIENEFLKMGYELIDSSRNQEFNCGVILSGSCDQEFMNAVLQRICYAYVVCVEKIMGKDICSFKKSEILKLKEIFPLNIILMIGSPIRGIEEVIIEQDSKRIEEK